MDTKNCKIKTGKEDNPQGHCVAELESVDKAVEFQVCFGWVRRPHQVSWPTLGYCQSGQ